MSLLRDNFNNSMKKIILLPQNDTVTICLPEQWVGIPIICKLTPVHDCMIHTNEYPFKIEKNVVDNNNKEK